VHSGGFESSVDVTRWGGWRGEAAPCSGAGRRRGGWCREVAPCSGAGRPEKVSACPSPCPHVEAAMAARPVLIGPPGPFPCLLGPWQSVTASPVMDTNTCFLDRTPTVAKRAESRGEEEWEQGDGGDAPWRSPHEAESETAAAAADDMRCSEGASIRCLLG
jgi:hypothetical protein